MSSDITFSSFAGGEISKAFYGRSDLESYYASARTLENVIASETGAAIGRGGSYYVFRAKSADDPSLLISFMFNEEQAYICEFGDHSVRFYKDRGVILESALNITGITQANPGVVTVNHNLTKGRTVLIQSVGGMTQLNGNFYMVDHVLGASKNITDIDRSRPARITFQSSHGFIGGQNVFIESVGGMTEVNDRTFELVDIVLAQATITGITQANPAVVTTSAAHGLVDGDTVYIENVGGMTQVNNLRFVISPKFSATVNISGATKANPCVITTSTNHGFDHGDRVRIESIVGMVELNDRDFTIARDLQAAKTVWVVNATPGSPVHMTTNSTHSFATGDFVYLSGFSNVNLTGLNNRQFTVTVVDTDEFTLDGTDGADYGGFSGITFGNAQEVNKNKFSLVGIDSTAYTTYSSGGTAKENFRDQFELDSTNSTGYTAYTSGGSLDKVLADEFFLYNENSLGHTAYTSGGTAKPVSATSFKLQDLDGNNVNTSGFGAYTSGGTVTAVHEVSSPYSAEDLFDENGLPRIQFAQSNDFIFLAHPDYPPQQLTRSGHANWFLTEFPNEEGPFLEENLTDTTIYVDAEDSPAVGATVNLYSSAPLWEQDHVAAFWLLRLPDISYATPWTTGTAYVAGDQVISNDLFYLCVDGGTSGTEAPTHNIGEAWDGPSTTTNVKWRYIHNGRGIVVITSVVNSQHAIGTVISELPAGVFGEENATGRWNEGAWSNAQGFPRAVEIHEGRLSWGGTEQEPLGLDFSSTESLFNYNPIELDGTIARSTAFRRVIDSGNPIRWLKTTEKGLLVGTLAGEWIVATEGVTQSFGPDTAVARQFSANGCAPIQPLRGGNSILYAQRSRRVLRDLQFTIDTQSFNSSDRNLKANHILLSGVKGMVFTEEPFKVAWCLLEDGTLAALTYNNEPNARVSCWHRHELAGTGAEIESIAVIPSPTEDIDDIWMCVKRTIDGEVFRYIEFLKRPLDLGDDFVDGVYLDCALTYDGAPATSFSGLGHLAGETVWALADGVLIEDVEISASGTTTLATAASVVHFGFYTPRVIETVNLEIVNEKTNTKMRKKRIVLAQLDMVESYGAWVGTNATDMDRIDFDVETGEEDPVAFDGAIYENVNDSFAIVKFLRVEQRGPWPFFVNSISCRVEVSDD